MFGIATLSLFAQTPDIFLTDKIALNDKSNSLKKFAFIESEKSGLTDFIYQRMEWEINPNVLYIDGVVTTHFKSKTENLNEIEFDLDSFLKVDSVTHNHISIPFNHTQNKIIIPLTESILENQIDSVSIYYS